MPLANAIWIPATVHHVVSEFLLNERQTNFADIPQDLIPWGMAVIDAPNLNNPQENHMRLRAFYNRRAPFFVEIPTDTQWYEVRNLTDNELDDLHVVAHPAFTSTADRNELRQVAARLPEPLMTPPKKWKRPILWGHEMSGPFSIFEGNHRLIAYASLIPPPGLDIPVFVGLSPTPCHWHIHDAVASLAQHLWPR
jgi:hypothetical protein